MALNIRTMRAIIDAPELEFSSILGDGLLVPNGKFMLYGPPGKFKSFAIQQMLYQLSVGRPWLNHAVQAAWNTLYIELEIVEGWFQYRTRQLALHGGSGVSDRAFYASPHTYLLDTNAVADQLSAQLDEYNIDVVFIDPLNLIITGTENSDEVTRRLVTICDRVRERASTKPAFGIVAHSNKGMYHEGKSVDRGFNDLSGSHQLSAWPDTIARIVPVPTADENTVRLLWQKCRYRSLPAEQWLKFNAETLMLEMSSQGPESALKRFLTESTPGTLVEVDQVLRDAGLSQSAAREFRKAAIVNGWLQVQRSTINHREKLFELTDTS
jgi:RecA-family ATPase